MFLSNLFPHHRGGGARVRSRGPSVVAQAVAGVICENLEPRQLLTAYYYTVPTGHTAAYLQETQTQGKCRFVSIPKRDRSITRLPTSPGWT